MEFKTGDLVTIKQLGNIKMLLSHYDGDIAVCIVDNGEGMTNVIVHSSLLSVYEDHAFLDAL